jgi:hypothetical protein
MSKNNLDFMYKRIFKPGDNPERIKQKVCQDIFISKLATNKDLVEKVVFKGGVVMYELTSGKRGYTKDIDLDFVKYSIEPESIKKFIDELNQCKIYGNIRIRLINTKPLNQEDYHGTRVELEFDDSSKKFKLLVDIGVYLDKLSIPDKIDYELRLSSNTVQIPIDSNNLSIYEKMSTFIMYSTDNERIHDLFDLYWRLNYMDYDICEIIRILDERLVYSGTFKRRDIIKQRLIKTFTDSEYLKEIKLEDNWTGVSIDIIIAFILDFVSENL